MAGTDADVIIAGAGPAGSIAAYELARQGIKVLVLEKTAFPRYKVCGGGLTHKILQEIPFDISEIIETVIRTVRFSNNFRDMFSRTSNDPLMYCTMRSALDEYLVEKAQSEGAEVLFLHQVTGVEEENDSVCVQTKQGSFRSKLLIGADGPASVVARSTGLRRDIRQGLAWEAEITTDPGMLSKYKETVFLDWGTFPGGYGWVFPKSDHFSVGVGGPASLSKQLMPYYRAFMDYLGFDNNRQTASVTSPDPNSHQGESKGQGPRSWPIPVRVKKGNFHSGLVVVAGDAAGLTDSLTGEGIYYAIRSGRLSAEACSGFLKGRPGALKTYSDQVNDELMTELLEGNKIKHIFNTVPLKIHLFVRDSDRAWRAFGKVLRGERNYRDVRSGFGKWKMLWNIACFMAGYYEKIQIWKYRKKA